LTRFIAICRNLKWKLQLNEDLEED
jgi:hypothetical protein